MVHTVAQHSQRRCRMWQIMSKYCTACDSHRRFFLCLIFSMLHMFWNLGSGPGLKTRWKTQVLEPYRPAGKNGEKFSVSVFVIHTEALFSRSFPLTLKILSFDANFDSLTKTSIRYQSENSQEDALGIESLARFGQASYGRMAESGLLLFHSASWPSGRTALTLAFYWRSRSCRKQENNPQRNGNPNRIHA